MSSKFAYVLAALAVLATAPVSGSTVMESTDPLLDQTASCVMVYVKYEASQPNLTVACDGNRYLSHTIRTEDKVENPVEFRSQLFSGFQVMVNPSGRKECKEYDYENIWWASCLSR